MRIACRYAVQFGVESLGYPTVALNATVTLIKLESSNMRARLHGVPTLFFSGERVVQCANASGVAQYLIYFKKISHGSGP